MKTTTKTKEAAQTETIEEVAPKQKFVALLSGTTLKTIHTARKDVQMLLPPGSSVAVRRLGQGASNIKPLNQSEDLGPDVIILGFSIPTNIVAQCQKAIEIPVGSGINRAQLAGFNFPTEVDGKPAAENIRRTEELTKALQATANVALRAYTANAVSALDSDVIAPEEAPMEDVGF